MMVKFIVPILVLTASLGFSLTPSEERQLLRDIAEIKATLKTFMEQVDKRFEQRDKRITELREDMNERFRQIDKRFEQVDRRFEELREDINKRFELINRELDRLVNIMVGVFAGQIALVVAVIGFAWWDRRTIIRKAKEETFEEMEKELKPEKFKKLLNILRERANTDKELAEILKRYGLL